MMIDIQGYEGVYAITDDGRVWSYQRKSPSGRPAKGQWIKQRISRGYYTVSLRKVGERVARTFFVHRLVLTTFKPIPEISRPEGNHIDGDKLNNRIENLEWTDSSGNRKHAWATGLIKQTDGRIRAGIQRGYKLRKLSDIQVEEIKNLISGGKPQTEVAKAYGIDRGVIYSILQRKTYLTERREL